MKVLGYLFSDGAVLCSDCIADETLRAFPDCEEVTENTDSLYCELCDVVLGEEVIATVVSSGKPSGLGVLKKKE